VDRDAATYPAGFDKHGELTHRTVFLAEMEQVVPWGKLCGWWQRAPANRLERMLRLHFLQHCWLARRVVGRLDWAYSPTSGITSAAKR
jgi:hypothetical protein